MKSVVRVALLALLALFLNACALSPKKEETRIASDELLARQMASVEKYLQTEGVGKNTVLYVGSAQHSQSLAFERDVLLVQKRLKEINPALQSIILSNQLQSNQLVYPFATIHTLGQIFSRIAQWSKQYRLTMVVLISTHGNVGLLSSNIANDYFMAVQPQLLRHWLDSAADTPTVVILSACYSGSFIPVLSSSQRIVMTSAAADRNSFGCSYRDDNTYFISNLFGKPVDSRQSWRQLFEQARIGVEAQEKSMGLSPSSNPDINAAGQLSNLTIGEMLRP